MLIYSLQTTFQFSPDNWCPESIVCFYTKREDASSIPNVPKRPVIFLFCEVPFDEVSGEFTTEAINVVLNYACELREKISNESIWLNIGTRLSRITFKKSGERSNDEFDFSLNIWRKKGSFMA